MGPAQSSQSIEQTFNMSNINKSVFEQITKNTQETAASQANIQNLEVVMRNGRGCNATFGQTIDATTQSSSEFSPEMTTDIKNAIDTEMKAAAGAALERTTQLGDLTSLLSDSNQDIQQSVNMEIENVVENTITTENLNKTIAEQVSIQGGRLIIDGYDCREGGQIDWNQNITAKLSADAVTKSLTKAVSQNKVLNTLAASADASSTSTGGGFAELVDSIGAALSGPFMYIAICVVVLIIGAVIFLLSPAGQNSSRTLSTAAARRI